MAYADATMAMRPKSSITSRAKGQPKFHWKDRPKGKNDLFFYRLRHMPPVSHWPNRPDPFNYENSEIIHHIMLLDPTLQFNRAKSLYDHARKLGVIIFDPETKLWKGCELWESEFTLDPEAMTAESSQCSDLENLRDRA